MVMLMQETIRYMIPMMLVSFIGVAVLLLTYKKKYNI